MKTINELDLHNARVLSNSDMKHISGGVATDYGTCWAKCNQYSGSSFQVRDCDRTTIESACGGNFQTGLTICTCY